MNDHVAKPINVEKLLSTLSRWLPDRVRAFVPPSAAAGAPPQVDGLPAALDGLDLAEGVKRVGGDRVLFRRLLLQFREHSGNAANEIRAALAAGDRAAAKSAVHTLKGVAGNLSATALYKAAQKLEAILRRGTEPAGAEVEAVSAEHARVMTALAALKAPAGNGASAPADPAAIQALLQNLDRRLSGSDATAAEVLEEFKGALNEAHPAFVQEMERLIGSYDFEQARARLAQFAETLKTSAA
jgi:HPt (histidine-containing phosphotransfer) domain-containing protein